jgi:hypothetical protein
LNLNLGPLWLPKQVWVLLALYCFASALHFAHNAEYIAFYPSMPSWLTREKVYGAWVAITCIGVLGVLLASAGWRTAAALPLAAYGALGLGGLGHYSLALCSQHTFFSNFTIWFEVVAGVALAASECWFVGVRFLHGRSTPRPKA